MQACASCRARSAVLGSRSSERSEPAIQTPESEKPNGRALSALADGFAVKSRAKSRMLGVRIPRSPWHPVCCWAAGVSTVTPSGPQRRRCPLARPLGPCSRRRRAWWDPACFGGINEVEEVVDPRSVPGSSRHCRSRCGAGAAWPNHRRGFRQYRRCPSWCHRHAERREADSAAGCDHQRPRRPRPSSTAPRACASRPRKGRSRRSRREHRVSRLERSSHD